MQKIVNYHGYLMLLNSHTLEVKLKLKIFKDELRYSSAHFPSKDELIELLNFYFEKYVLKDVEDLIPFLKFVLSKINSDIARKYGVLANIISMDMNIPVFRKSIAFERIFNLMKNEIISSDEKTKDYLILGANEEVKKIREFVKELIDAFLKFTRDFKNVPKTLSELFEKYVWKVEESREFDRFTDVKATLFKKICEKFNLIIFYDEINGVELLRTSHIKYISTTNLNVILIGSVEDNSFINNIRNRQRWLIISDKSLEDTFKFIQISDRVVKVNLSKRMLRSLSDVLVEFLKTVFIKKIKEELKLKDRYVISKEEFKEFGGKKILFELIEKIKKHGFDIQRYRDFMMIKLRGDVA